MWKGGQGRSPTLTRKKKYPKFIYKCGNREQEGKEGGGGRRRGREEKEGGGGRRRGREGGGGRRREKEGHTIFGGLGSNPNKDVRKSIQNINIIHHQIFLREVVNFLNL
jgi:hypothetical protein